MNGLTIQIREEEKSFAKSHLAEVLNVSRSTISRWIEKGKIPRPSGHKGKFSRNNIEAIFRTLNFVPPRKFNTKGNRDSLNWLKKSGLTIERGGIFNAARLARYSEKEFSDMLDKPGLWDTQGWLNFQRMEDLVRNPIIQLTLAKELIDYWIKKVRELNPN